MRCASVRIMASTNSKAKRPQFKLRDTVQLSSIKSMIPAHDGKPAVLGDTRLSVSSITGTGSKRNPYHVVMTDGVHFWHLEPDDVVLVHRHGPCPVCQDGDCQTKSNMCGR